MYVAKKRKHHDETWSVILGPMFSKETRGEDGNDTVAIDTQEQAVEKELQKYLAVALMIALCNGGRSTSFVSLYFRK